MFKLGRTKQVIRKENGIRVSAFKVIIISFFVYIEAKFCVSVKLTLHRGQEHKKY